MTRIKILTTGQTGASRAASATSVTPAGNIAATNVQAALEELDAEKQPLDSDLTAIAALSTQSFGRSLLTQASASAARTTLGVDYTTIAADSALTSRFASVVSHGSTAGTARTTGAAQVVWLGTVEPTNGVDGDLWVSATGLSFRASGVWSTTTSNAFVPSSVTGLIAWFRADLITGLANADPISTWTDLSGNGNNLTSTSTARPTYRTNVINGKAVARFDGINDYMTRTYSSALTQPTTIFVVYKAATLEQTVIIDGLGSSRHSILTEAGTNYLRMYAGTTIVGTTAFTTSAAVVSATFSGAASDMRLNGTTIITGNPGTQTMSGINLGADPGFAYYFDGDIAEVLIYNSALSLADRQYVERALGTFYGVTVA